MIIVFLTFGTPTFRQDIENRGARELQLLEITILIFKPSIFVAVSFLKKLTKVQSYYAFGRVGASVSKPA